MKNIILTIFLSLISFNSFSNTLEELAEENLKKAIQNSQYEKSIFTVTCSKLYNKCSTMEVSLEELVIDYSIQSMKHVKEESQNIVVDKPIYLAREMSDVILLSFSYDINIFKELKEYEFSGSNIQIPRSDFNGSIQQKFVLSDSKKEYKEYQDFEKFSILIYKKY